MRQKKKKKFGGGSYPPGKCFFLGVGNVRILGVVNVRILGVVNVLQANDSQSFREVSFQVKDGDITQEEVEETGPVAAELHEMFRYIKNQRNEDK